MQSVKFSFWRDLNHCAVLRLPCRFSDLRNDWLAGGDVARDAQTNYTMRVERIPRAFRSPAILNKFFSELFPGQVRQRTVVSSWSCSNNGEGK